MCNIFNFYPLLITLFTVLLSSTVLRKELTYRGIFYLFITVFLILAMYLTSIFNNVILMNSHSEFSLNFNSINWLSIEVSLSLRLDGLSYLFVLLVTLIGLATNFYILNYLKYEAHEDIFVILINWFVFSMILLVLANNLFTLFLGWESIGLSSFFLINFWSTRRGTLKSSFKAFFFNKISDVFLFIFLVGIHYLTYTNTITLINLKFFLNIMPTSYSLTVVSVFLFMCTLFKSAQLFGHLWLPDSMEAPVPASALIHSATLVSAGIFLLLRFTPLITLNNLQLWSITIGSLTAAYGGLVSSSQTDMKKLLAYSTISHCGFLFVTIGAEIYVTTVIYLFLHGLFKALTFFCAGSFIRVAGSQDTRQMGNLSRVIPVDTIFLIICSFNLGGLPFSLGYLYKSMLITSFLNTSTFYVTTGFCAVGLLTSIVYTYRLVYYSGFDTTKEFFNSLVYELQQKQNNITNHYSLTTPVQIIAILLLLVFTIWVYMFFINYFVYSNLIIDHMPITLESSPNLNITSNIFFKNYYELFYILYVLILCILSNIVWRNEYTHIYKLNTMLCTVGSLIFFIIYTTLLK